MSSHKEQIASHITKYWNGERLGLSKLTCFIPIVDVTTENPFSNFKAVRTVEEFIDCITYGKIFIFNRESVEKNDRDFYVLFADHQLKEWVRFYQVEHLFIIKFGGITRQRNVTIRQLNTPQIRLDTLEEIINKITEIYENYINDPNVVILRERPVTKTKEELPIVKDFLLTLIQKKV